MRIKDWPKFQHFKDRRPPWIKLYRDLLEDDQWYELPAASAKILISLWLLASEDETKHGLLPSVKKTAFRLRITEKALLSACSELAHWLIQDDITTISPPRQLVPSETETETETEGEGEPRLTTLPPPMLLVPKLGKRAIRDDDGITEKHLAFAASLKLDPGPEWGKFKNYCLANDRRYANFDAAFRNWLARAAEMKGDRRVL